MILELKDLTLQGEMALNYIFLFNFTYYYFEFQIIKFLKINYLKK